MDKDNNLNDFKVLNEARDIKRELIEDKGAIKNGRNNKEFNRGTERNI